MFAFFDSSPPPVLVVLSTALLSRCAGRVALAALNTPAALIT